MAKKKEYQYTGPTYRQISLETGDVRLVKPKRNDDGSVEVRVWGNSEMRKVNLFYRSEEDFKAKWKEL